MCIKEKKKEPGCFYLRLLRLQEQRTHMKKRERQRHEEERERDGGE